MKSKRFGQMTLGGLVSVAVLGFATAAQAEAVSYDFSADIIYVNSNGQAAAAGLPVSGTISGTFSYDSESGWNGNGSNSWSDPTLSFTNSGVSLTPTSLTLLAGGDGVFSLKQTSQEAVSVQLSLPGQSIAWNQPSLPTSLSVAEGSYISFFVGDYGSFADLDLAAQITSLVVSGSQTVAGAVSTPELDPASGSAALVLLLGGAALMGGTRRRRGFLSA